MPVGEPIEFWGKLRAGEGGRPAAWHPLVHHCADVAACADALLTRTLLGRRLAILGGQTDLTRRQVERLGVLAAIHDFGKFSVGFQNQKLEGRAALKCGHLGEALGLLFTPGYAFTAPAWDVLALDEIAAWGDDMRGLLWATICHHGRPIDATASMKPEWWAPTAELDPFSGIQDLVAQTRKWFPGAWETDAEALPTNPECQHAWAGILNLADWIGSDSERFFPFSESSSADRMADSRAIAKDAVAALGLEPVHARLAVEPRPIGYESLLPPDAQPRAVQKRMLDIDLPTGEPSIVVVESATGSGKTEAALFHFVRLFREGAVDGLYFALPLRAAAIQIHQRVRVAVANTFPAESRPPVVLAVPGYRRVDEVDGYALAPFTVSWPHDDDIAWRYRGWAAENPKRFLAGGVVVGTVDQVLLSSLMVRHAHLRASALLRHLLVVDEVHASEAYMARLLEDVLERHVAAGGHVLLMSATLGSSVRSRLVAQASNDRQARGKDLESAQVDAYPLITVSSGSAIQLLPVADEENQKVVTFEIAPIMDDPERIADQALEAARDGGRVVVIRNTVAACREVQVALEGKAESGADPALLFTCSGVPAPHHSRFAAGDRRLLDEALEVAYGKQRSTGQGLVTVATQTVEQSLDLDSDFLITDLCPMDVLLQRVGRLHRHSRERPHSFDAARAVVLVPDEPDLSGFIDSSGEGVGHHGLGRVYEDVRILQLTWDLLVRERVVSIPADNRRLVELATHPEALATLVAEDRQVWEAHARWVTGQRVADRGVAGLNLISWQVPFDELRFPSDRRVPTRLGDEDRLVHFDPPVRGPFGAEVHEIRLRSYFIAAGTPADLDTASDVEPADGIVHFSFGAKRFTYDRLGLRPSETV